MSQNSTNKIHLPNSRAICCLAKCDREDPQKNSPRGPRLPPEKFTSHGPGGALGNLAACWLGQFGGSGQPDKLGRARRPSGLEVRLLRGLARSGRLVATPPAWAARSGLGGLVWAAWSGRSRLAVPEAQLSGGLPV